MRYMHTRMYSQRTICCIRVIIVTYLNTHSQHTFAHSHTHRPIPHFDLPILSYYAL